MPAGEFDIIRDVFAPLSAGAGGAFGLADDAALLASGEYVVTKDLLVEGVHFLKSDPLDLVAKKLLRVNLSDLAAKGARPAGYFLGCVWRADVKRAAIETFAEGLAADQELFRIQLLGGDTTRHLAPAAPLTLSATFFGAPPRAGIIRRNGAQVGDDVYVSGSIGDAGLGLALLEKREKATKAAKDYLVERYRLPSPRLTLGGALAAHASAALDVSDGLVADAGHLAAGAGVRLEIDAGALPLSEAAQGWLEGQAARDEGLAQLAGFGDDYEILFTAPPSRRRAVEMAGNLSKTAVTRIGAVTKGAGARLTLDGKTLDIPVAGFDHFR